MSSCATLQPKSESYVLPELPNSWTFESPELFHAWYCFHSACSFPCPINPLINAMRAYCLIDSGVVRAIALVMSNATMEILHMTVTLQNLKVFVFLSEHGDDFGAIITSK